MQVVCVFKPHIRFSLIYGFRCVVIFNLNIIIKVYGADDDHEEEEEEENNRKKGRSAEELT